MLFDPTPTKLVDDRQPHHGVFSSVPENTDLRAMRGGLGSGLRFKTWHHFLIDSPGLSLTVAMVDLGFLNTAWVRCIPHDGPSFEIERRSPLTRCRIEPVLRGSSSEYRGRGFSLQLHHNTPQQHHLKLTSKRVAIDLRLDGRDVQPLAVCLPLGEDQSMYSQKMPLSCNGEVILDGQTHVFDDAQAMIDVHQAYYPHRTAWRWATAAWRSANGALCGFNLTRNQAQNPERFHECALWHEGRIERLSLPDFKVPEDPLKPWMITSSDGRVELLFQPQGLRRDDTRIGPIKSWYLQPWGRFSGTLLRADGQPTKVDAFGVCEDHNAHW
jgi:hypothetical protein